MLKIEVKDMICDAEIDGEFAEVMTAGKEKAYDIKGKTSEGAAGIGH